MNENSWETENIKKAIIKKIDIIADSIANNKDIELRKSKDGVSVAEKTVKIISK